MAGAHISRTSWMRVTTGQIKIGLIQHEHMILSMHQYKRALCKDASTLLVLQRPCSRSKGRRADPAAQLDHKEAAATLTGPQDQFIIWEEQRAVGEIESARPRACPFLETQPAASILQGLGPYADSVGRPCCVAELHKYDMAKLLAKLLDRNRSGKARRGWKLFDPDSLPSQLLINVCASLPSSPSCTYLMLHHIPIRWAGLPHDGFP